MFQKIVHYSILLSLVASHLLSHSAKAQESSEKPFAICNCQLTFVYNNECQLIVRAEDIDNGSYSPTGEDLTLEIFDYYREPQEEILYEEACYGQDLRWIKLVVTGESGLSDTCGSLVDLQRGSCTDIDFFCDPCMPSSLISGSFYTPEGQPISNIDLFFNGTNEGPFNHQYCYYYCSPGAYENWFIIEPQKEDDIQRGLSVLDLVLIRAAQLEKVELSHFQKIAGDISDNERVSLRDAIELKQVLLNDLDEFSQSPDWRFFPANHEFGGDTWERPIPYYIELDYESRHENVDFIGVKMGDVSGDSWGRAHPRTASFFTVQTEDRLLEAGEEMTIDFASSALDQTSGYQFTLEFDPNRVEFLDYDRHLTEAELNLDRLDEGLIAVAKVQDKNKAHQLFGLQFRARQNTLLSQSLAINSKVIPALAYNTQYEEMDVQLSFTNQATSYMLHQNTPNPFSRQTTVSFHMAKPGEASLVIMDNQGRVLVERNRYYQAGYNSESFNRAQLPASGLFYYQLKAADFTATRKMLVVK